MLSPFSNRNLCNKIYFYNEVKAQDDSILQLTRKKFMDNTLMIMPETAIWQPAPVTLTLKPGEIHIWHAQMSAHFEEILSFTQVLAPDEQMRAARFKFPIHQQRYVIARGILRQLLARYLKCPPQEIDFHYTQYGKPLLASPISNPRLYFNISHSENIALYAFSLTADLGVDIENIRADIEAENIAERFFATEEVQMLKHLTAEQKIAAFFAIWTKKEAFIKAIGQGLTFSLQDFVVNLAHDSKSLVSISKGHAQDWSLLTLVPEPGYIAAIAVKTIIENLKLYGFT